jgi:hypothetical protein
MSFWLGKKRFILGLFIAIFVIFILIATGLWLNDTLQQKIIVVNRSTVLVNSIEISFNNKIIKFTNLKPGATIAKNIVPNADDAFAVIINFSDGTVIKKERLGYITHGDT